MKCRFIRGVELERLEATFGVDSGRMAVRNAVAHAVFDNRTTTYVVAGQYAVIVGGTASFFAQGWSNPALLFDHMQDTEYTRVSKVLRDAVGRQEFGKARLIAGTHSVRGTACYLVEGTYDRAKLLALDRSEPIPWKYRLYIAPRYGMQPIRKETYNVISDIPLGIVEITGFEQQDDIWLPSAATLTTYRYELRAGKLEAEPAIATLFSVSEDTVVINDQPDPGLFRVEWPAGTRVQDQVNNRYYIEGTE